MPNEANPVTGATSIAAAAATGLFGGPVEEAKPAPKAEKPRDEQPNPDEGQPHEEPQPEVEAAAKEEGEPPTEPVDGEQEEQAAEAEAPKDVDLDAEGDRPITLKIDGKDVKLSLKEAAKGFQLEQDYRRKTSDLAEQRKAHEAERAQWGTERQSHAETLRKIHLSVQQMVVGEPPSIEMLDPASQKYDPNAYHLHKAQFEQRARQFTAQLQELDRAESEERTKHTEARKAQKAEHMRRLVEVVPEFAKPETARAVVAEIGKVLQPYGFSEQEIRQVGDYRMVHLLVDFVRGKATKAGIEAKRVAPKPSPSVKPSAGQVASQTKATQVAAAKGNLAKNRDLRSAAGWFGAKYG